jgi:hypothetical protein
MSRKLINELNEKIRVTGPLSERDQHTWERLNKLADLPDEELFTRKREIDSELKWRNDQLPLKLRIKHWWQDIGWVIAFILIFLVLVLMAK